jgi:hypothetical protein
MERKKTLGTRGWAFCPAFLAFMYLSWSMFGSTKKLVSSLCFPFEKHLGILAVFVAVRCIPQDSICIDSGIHPL